MYFTLSLEIMIRCYLHSSKLFLFCILLFSVFAAPFASAQEDEYLSWSAKQAEQVGKSMRASGRVGSLFGFRGLSTERASNYKLRATWLTPEVIRATARLEQLKRRLSEEQVMALVDEADVPEFTVILVELDPNEGSGVIPLDWGAFLQPKGLAPGQPGATPGISSPKLREFRALSGVVERDYDYDRFWVVFPIINDEGQPLFSDSFQEAELVVRIHNMEGKVSWRIPLSIHKRITAQVKKSGQETRRDTQSH